MFFQSDKAVSLTFTFDGTGSPGNSTQNSTVTRIGNIVTVHLGLYRATTGTGSTNFTSTALPSWAWPVRTTTWVCVIGRDNNSTDNTYIARLSLDTTGIFTLNRSISNDPWTNGQSGGFQGVTSISYSVE